MKTGTDFGAMINPYFFCCNRPHIVSLHLPILFHRSAAAREAAARSLAASGLLPWAQSHAERTELKIVSKDVFVCWLVTVRIGRVVSVTYHCVPIVSCLTIQTYTYLLTDLLAD